MESYRDIGELRVIDSSRMWNSVDNFKPENKFRALMSAGGVDFFDEEHFFVKEPSVGLTGVGGLPITFPEKPEDHLRIANLEPSIHYSAVSSSLREMVAASGFFTYMNSNSLTTQSMYSRLVDGKHLSTAHTVYLNFVVLGLSEAVENEFNSQRDLVHLSRFTEARTRSQSLPSIVVPDSRHLDFYKELYKSIVESLKKYPPRTDQSVGDYLEGRNVLFPGAKATGFMMSATLRNLNKLVEGVDDPGKEVEYRRILSLLNNNLNVLFPEIFTVKK